MPKLIDLIEQKFGRLTVTERSYPNGKWGLRWLCKCECGAEKIVTGDNLRSGYTKSCGCLSRLDPGPGIASMRGVLGIYKRIAKNRSLKFELTEKQFFELAQKDCYYCGAKPSNINKTKSNNGEYVYNGLDRIDNTKGYTIDNVVSCCRTFGIIDHIIHYRRIIRY